MDVIIDAKEARANYRNGDSWDVDGIFGRIMAKIILNSPDSGSVTYSLPNHLQGIYDIAKKFKDLGYDVIIVRPSQFDSCQQTSLIISWY